VIRADGKRKKGEDTSPVSEIRRRPPVCIHSYGKKAKRSEAESRRREGGGQTNSLFGGKKGRKPPISLVGKTKGKKKEAAKKTFTMRRKGPRLLRAKKLKGLR